MRLQVHVQRRETERQHEQRINSYAFLAAREREEAWIPIQARPACATARIPDAGSDSTSMHVVCTRVLGLNSGARCLSCTSIQLIIKLNNITPS